MRVLLDTHVFIWWDSLNSKLPASVADIIRDGRNDIFVSAATAWEISTKRRLGKIDFSGSVCEAIQASGFSELPVSAVDAEFAGAFEWRHRDPFDRLLLAQAHGQSLTFVTADHTIREFSSVNQIWAGGN